MNKPRFYYILFAVLLLAIFLYFNVLKQETEHVFESKDLNVVDSPVIENDAKDIGGQNNIELIFVGDIMLSRDINSIMQRQNDWKYPFLKMDEFLKSVDLTIGNLESPISERGVNVGSIYSFRANPNAIEGLLHASFDVLSIANNHIFDWTRLAMEDTIDLLKEKGIEAIGAGRDFKEANRPYIADIRGTKIAFLAYTNLFPRSLVASETQEGLSDFSFENVKKSIEEVRGQVDVVVLLWHWGQEYKTRSDSKEQALARSLIDEGADLIIGHHPHVAQEVEEYNRGYIAYSLGNFVFDQNFSQDTRRGLVLKIVLQNGKVVNIEQIEIQFTPDFQPFIPDK